MDKHTKPRTTSTQAIRLALDLRVLADTDLRTLEFLIESTVVLVLNADGGKVESVIQSETLPF